MGPVCRATITPSALTTIVADADGVIVARHTGPIDAAGLRDLLAESLPDLQTNRARTR